MDLAPVATVSVHDKADVLGDRAALQCLDGDRSHCSVECRHEGEWDNFLIYFRVPLVGCGGVTVCMNIK